jgi:hypothetical protein
MNPNFINVSQNLLLWRKQTFDSFFKSTICCGLWKHVLLLPSTPTLRNFYYGCTIGNCMKVMYSGEDVNTFLSFINNESADKVLSINGKEDNFNKFVCYDMG